jgi:16S rRNA (cytosine967-C5)-methyltransferase
LNSRAVAATVLRRVIADRSSLTAALEEVLPKVAQDNDRAFIQALCFGVMRWYEWLDAVLKSLTTKPIRDEEVRMLALLGLYQLQFTRVKPHAAVAETVAASGRKSWAKPFLNGVLRNFQRERDALIAQVEGTETARCSHPAWLLKRIRADWPDQADVIFTRANEQAPLTLRVNRRQQGRDDYLDSLKAIVPEAEACPFSPDGIVLSQPIPLDRLPGFSQGWISVQDEAAQLAAGLLDASPGQRVLDVCAAPGGKTVHILETCPDLAELVAVDISEDRLTRVRENLARAGLTATVLAGDAAAPACWWDGKPFDTVLLDAPCSATGVIRRHPDIKWLRQPGDIATLAGIQADILDAVWGLLKPGGTLLYATCSILRQENAEQIAAFLRRTPDAKELPIQAEWGNAQAHGRQVLTGDGGMDGFFYARLSKLAP